MAYRQRNIPVTSKQQIEVQTDIRLLEPYLFDRQQQQQQQQQGHTDIRLSRVYSRSGLLRPFTDQHLLKEFSRTLLELRSAQPADNVFAKRLELLEKQIEGLLKRDLLINGVAEGAEIWNSYYMTLNQKEKSIIRSENEKMHSDLKIQRLRLRIDELEQEVALLRSALVSSQKATEENKLYAGFYERINQLVTSGKYKGADLDRILQEQIVPITTEFSFNLASLTRTINKDIQQSTRSVVTSVAREFDRLLKEQQFNEDKLNETVSGLLTNFKALKGVDYLKKQFELAQRTELSEENYRSMLSLFKHEIDCLKNDVPNLKGMERLDTLLRKLESEGIELFNCNGWVNLVQPEIKVLEVSTEDKKLRGLIGVIAAEFKRAYNKFPELKAHVSGTVIEILESELLLELIDGGSIERLKEIIVHQVETVRVDNVYQYEGTKQKKAIFNLRIVIKRLFEELELIRKTHGLELALDEGIMAIIKEHAIEGFNADEYISLFRPVPRYVEVPVVVEKPMYETKTYEKGVVINSEQEVLIKQNKVQVVTINKEIPVYIDKPIEHIINNNIAVAIETQKAVPVEVNRDVVVERIVESAVEVPVIREKAVAMQEREEVVKEVEVDRIVESIQFKEIEKAVEVGGREYIEVERIVEKPCYLYETRQTVKQVEVRVPQIIKQTEYVEVEKSVPYIVERREVVNIEREVPIEIKVPEITTVELIEYRDKPIIIKEYKEVVKEMIVTHDKELIKQVPKEIFIERSHFIKGDTIEVIREVEVFIEKPIIHEIMTSKDVEIEKVVPLYITEQVPVIHEVSVPYFTEKIKELEVETVKLVPVKEEIVKPIHIEKPVPVIVEKEIVRIEQQIVERIVEKIVEVPRIVEIEKIVEKIVVVPRIIEKIVEVPKIIERIVVIEQPILQIVEIPVPYIVIQEVEKPIEVIVEKIVIQIEKQIEIVEVEKIVERIVYQDRPVEIEVERRVPFEVVREVPVPTYRDRIEYQKVEIHDTKVETIEVQVPFIVQEKVPFIIEKPITTEHIIEQAVFEKIYYEKEKPIINQIEKLVIREVTVERPIITEIVKEIPGPETIKYVYEPKIVEVIKEKIVEIHDRVEVPKEIYLEQEKIVHQIHEKLVEVPINQIVVTPQLIEVPKLVHLLHYKEIPVDVPVREERVKRDIIEQIKQVEVIKEVPVEVEICREKIKEITNEIKQFITNEVVKEIHSEVEVRTPVEYQEVHVAGKTVVQEINNTNKEIQVQERIIERIVEKIVMLPQIVEVVKHIHHISEVNSLGVAVDVDVNVQTQKYLGVTQQLRQSLLELLKNFRSNVGRQPDLKNLIVIIEKYLKFIDDWIAFPKLIEIPKEIIREVEKEKIVLVPTQDKEKEATLSYILEKLLNQLRRIRQSHKITLSLDDDLLKIFFPEKRVDDSLDGKLSDMLELLKGKYRNYGDWSESNPFLVNAFLQDHLSLRTIIDESNQIQEEQIQQINLLRHKLEIATNKYHNLLCFNRKMFDDNAVLIKTLEKYRSTIEDEEFNENIRHHRDFYEELTEQKHSFIISSIKKSVHISESYVEEYSGQSRVEHVSPSKSGFGSADKGNSFGELVGKLSRYENRNQELELKSKSLEYEWKKLSDELEIKNNIIKRLETDFETRLTRARDELAKNPNLNKELFEENKKLQEKNRTLEKEASAEKLTADRNRKELERSLENQKKDFEIKIERKEKELKQSTERIKKENERQLNRIKQDLERVKKDKERFELQLVETKKKASDEIKLIREQQLSSASDKYNQLINENIELRRKSDSSDQEYEKLKRAAADNNMINEKEISRLRAEIDRLSIEKREWEKSRKQGFLDLPQETQIINKNIELTRKIESLETELNNYRGKEQGSSVELRSLKEKVKKLEIELETSKKEVEIAQKSRLQATTFTSGFKPSVSIVENVNVEGSVIRSPRASGYKSTIEKAYMSPESSQQSREERIEEFASSSSRVSQSSEEASMPSYYKSQMTLREFMDAKNSDEKERDMYVTFVMIKVIEKIEEEADGGMFNSYSPSNIYLNNFNIRHLDKLTIKFGAHIINKTNKTDGLYLAPEVLGGAIGTKKSCVFCLGVILDELIHGSTFFKSIEEIQNLQIEFKVRGDKLNPILKNTLFEMMNKEPNKRLDLLEAKRRLSLQKYISSESRSTITTTTRMTRGRMEE